jgi:hypothetical protein
MFWWPLGTHRHGLTRFQDKRRTPAEQHPAAEPGYGGQPRGIRSSAESARARWHERGLADRVWGTEAAGQVVALRHVSRRAPHRSFRLENKDEGPMDGKPLALADALTEAAQAINKHNSLEETLDAIVHATRSSVPGFTDVGISITHRDGKIETMSGTGQLVWELDAIQYSLGEGPCVDSVHQAHTVVVENARHDQRWPRFMPQAVQRGLRSQLALRLYKDGKTLGGFNMYSTASDRIDPEAVHAARLIQQQHQGMNGWRKAALPMACPMTLRIRDVAQELVDTAETLPPLLMIGSSNQTDGGRAR